MRKVVLLAEVMYVKLSPEGKYTWNIEYRFESCTSTCNTHGSRAWVVDPNPVYGHIELHVHVNTYSHDEMNE